LLCSFAPTPWIDPMSSAAAITNVNARFAFVLLIGFLLNFYYIKKLHNIM
jgi:hypothetical protein